MISIIKGFLFILSSIGSWELIRRNSKIHVYFLPSLTVAIQTAVLFIAGLLYILPAAVWLLYAIGFLGILYSIYRDRGGLKNYLNIGFIFLGIILVVMAIFLRGKLFTHYDNFSHWAIVVKGMLEVDSYPGFQYAITMFQEYPLGSATYIYYVSKLISTSEPMQMLAQVYMMLVCIIPLFIFVKKNKIASAIMILSATNFIFVYNIGVTNLLVDTLLPLVGMCGLLYSYCYCQKESGKLELFFTAFYMIQLMQIKNSGIFFVAMICIGILINIRKDKKMIARLTCVALPFLSFGLWKKHCSDVYIAAETSKHAMTLKNYSAVFGGKTADDIQTICSSMLKFAITWKDVWLTFGVVLLVGILIFAFAKDEKSSYIKITILSVALYAVYQIGVLAMYLFSMPLGEAVSLAGNTRYTKSILIAILYLTMISAIKLISCIHTRKMVTAAATVILCVSFCVHMHFSLGKIRIAVKYYENPAERNWIEEARKEYKIPRGSSYCILLPGSDAGYAYHLLRYMFLSNAINPLIAESFEDMDHIDSRYIFVYDQKNEVANEWIEKNYPDQYGNKVIVR